jgi:uncharacterized membrane protein
VKADRALGIALILATGLVWVLYALQVDSPVRAVVAIIYLIVVPGAAVVSLLDLAQRWAAALLAVALSLGIVTLVATALLLANAWTPGRALAIAGCITLLAAGARLTVTSGASAPDVATVPGMERREDGN